MSQAFFVQVEPHKDVLSKVSSGEVEFLSAIKCCNKKNANKINENKLNKIKSKEARILPSLSFGKNASGAFISS